MFKSTTILAVRHRDRAVLASDGQVTFGQTVVKQGARKIRRLYNDRVLAGFAGSAADSFALFARFESKLEQYRGNLERSAVELAKVRERLGRESGVGYVVVGLPDNLTGLPDRAGDVAGFWLARSTATADDAG